jgi:hypothetical protein
MIWWILIEIALLLIFVGAVFRSLKNHRMGDLIIYEEEGRKIFSLELTKHPEEIEDYKYVIFRVNRRTNKDYNEELQKG